MTIKIPDELARRLERLAKAEKKSVEQVAVERLRLMIANPGSPSAILRAMREPPHLNSSVIDDLEGAIRDGRLPVSNRGVFDR